MQRGESKAAFPRITQGLCWAWMGLGGDGWEEAGFRNLINQVRNQPCENPTSCCPPRAQLVLGGIPPPSLAPYLPSCIREQPGRWDAAVGTVPLAPGTR